MPLALLDYGERPIQLDKSTSLGLISANCAIRRELLLGGGGFAPELQRVRDSIGSMEDQELFERLIQMGARGLYWPAMTVNAVIAPERLTRSYHRRWHFGHGTFYALYRSPRIERSKKGRFLDVPVHLYKQVLVDVLAWLKHLATFRAGEAFIHETRIRFSAGYILERLRQHFGNRAGTKAAVRGARGAQPRIR